MPRTTEAVKKSAAAIKSASLAVAPQTRRPPRKSSFKTPTTQQAPVPEPVITLSHDQIAQRALEIWLSKGRPLGLDEQNWLEAEAQLRLGLGVADKMATVAKGKPVKSTKS